MRETEASTWLPRNSSNVPLRALKLAAVVLGVGLVMTVGVARAQDDDDDDRTFEEKIIGNLMAGIGATNMENKGIDYRERSPLVVPPTIDLPPPGSTSARSCRTAGMRGCACARSRSSCRPDREAAPTRWPAWSRASSPNTI